MPDLDLAAIRARTDAATEGPWSADPTGTVCAKADLLPDGKGGEILPLSGPMEVAECYRDESPGERAKNAEFIAHSRADVPALLDLVEVQAAELERLRGEVADAAESRRRVAAAWDKVTGKAASR